MNKKSNIKSKTPLKDRISKIIESISAGMHEREEIMAVALLGALSGQNTFLFGPPGTAKSLISRRLACAFKNPEYFECLMNRFTEPSEVVGPVSVKALKEDKYTRKTKGFLPTADFAFLDEIWKSSPAILNTLLTIINEHIYRNGDEITQVPLKALIAASNETPQANQGLEALYDRFIIRMLVPPIQDKLNFDSLLAAKPSASNIELSNDLLITQEEWLKWQQELHEVSLSSETTNIIHLIREELSEKAEELDIYVSDRRWQRAAMLMKASAYFCDRKQTNHSDAVLLQYCLWTTPENRKEVANIVKSAVKACGFVAPLNMVDIQRKKENLEKEIEKELFYQHDVYKTVKLFGDTQFFKVKKEFIHRNNQHHNRGYRNDEKVFYIPISDFRSKKITHPYDELGNKTADLTVSFDNQGTCYIEHNGHNYDEKLTFTPDVLFHKGDRKEEVNERLIDALILEVQELKSNLSNNQRSISQKYKNHLNKLNTPFISEKDTVHAINGFDEQKESLELKIKDCDRLESLCS